MVQGSTELAWAITAYIDIIGPNRELHILPHGASQPNMFVTLTFSKDMIICDQDKTFPEIIEIK